MFSSSDSWLILNPIEQSIKAKIEAVGTPLKDWDIQINYGIKTGFNGPLEEGGCFIIADWKRKEILDSCHTQEEQYRTDELIRPILRGRDIKRYAYEWAGQYLIATHNGIHENGILRIDIAKYPAVRKHLDSHRQKVEDRADQGDTPYNLRSCAYMEDFSKQKIVWGNLSLSAAFSSAPGGMFVNAPCPMIVPFNGYLLAILNSKLGDWYIRQNGVTRNGGYFEYKPMFVERLPVPMLSPIDQTPFALLAAHPNSKNQREIDALVYKLYGLSDKEIAYIEAPFDGR